jgi:hypothetical protein
MSQLLLYLFMTYLKTLSRAENITALNDNMTVNNELKKMW